MSALVSVEEARSRLLALVARGPAERVELAAADTRVLAEPVIALRDQPPFAASSMDGWAVRRADGLTPRRIVGESAAGHAFEAMLGPGEAVRIFTGAPVPTGADLVVIQEEASREGEILHVAPQGDQAWIRPAGLDFRAGDLLLGAGEPLDPWRLALAAAAGRASLSLVRRPAVAVLPTGEEVVSPGATPGPAQIFESAGPAICALLRRWGASPLLLPIARDDESAIAEAVAGASADLVVTLGGASVGDHDLVKPALRRLGLSLALDGVALRPGKPTWGGGLASGVALLGLPGNPASALVCAELFLRPMVRQMLGLAPDSGLGTARLEKALPPNGSREHWMRAVATTSDDGWTVRPLEDQDSSLVSVFSRANVLLRRPPRAPQASVGEAAPILRLDRAG